MSMNTINTNKQSHMPPVLALILFALLFAGCSKSNLAYVNGKVLIDGQPAPEGLVVQFQPLDKNGSPSSSFTDKDGNYELQFSKTVKGAQIGSSKVTVTQPQCDDMPLQTTLPFLASFNRNMPPTYEVKSGQQTYDIIIDTSTIPVIKKTGKRKKQLAQ